MALIQDSKDVTTHGCLCLVCHLISRRIKKARYTVESKFWMCLIIGDYSDHFLSDLHPFHLLIFFQHFLPLRVVARSYYTQAAWFMLLLCVFARVTLWMGSQSPQSLWMGAMHVCQVPFCCWFQRAECEWVWGEIFPLPNTPIFSHPFPYTHHGLNFIPYI